MERDNDVVLVAAGRELLPSMRQRRGEAQVRSGVCETLNELTKAVLVVPLGGES